MKFHYLSFTLTGMFLIMFGLKLAGIIDHSWWLIIFPVIANQAISFSVFVFKEIGKTALDRHLDAMGRIRRR